MLVIEPRPAPLRPGGEIECPYQTSAVDLRLGDEIVWLREGLPINIDLRDGGFSELLTGPHAERARLTATQPFSLRPRHFVLGRTMERVGLPLHPNRQCLAARVEGRSSYARCGLVVHLTAPTIHAGFAGTITLEMMNFGPYPILLYPGTPICQLVVEQVDRPPFANDSAFQGQSSPEGR